MQLVDEFLRFLQSLLADAGLEVDLALLRGLFALVVLAATLVAGYKILRVVYGWVGSGVEFVAGQIEQKFWQDTGKLRTFLTFVLLAIAYGFYGKQQSRPLGDALVDLGREQLLSVLPLAIVTQWVLLCCFWVVFGLLMGLRGHQLRAPLEVLTGAVALSIELVLFTIALLSLIGGDLGLAGLAVLAMFPVTYVFLAAWYDPERAQPDQAATGPRWPRTHAENAASRLQVRPVAVLVYTGLWSLVFAIPAVIVVLVYVLGGFSPPTLGGVIRVELIVMVVFFLLSCLGFRAEMQSTERVPPVLFHFIDLSLALSTVVIALTQLPSSTVTLGPVPSWLVAAGPPLLVAAMVFGLHLLKERENVKRWRACLVACGAVALVAGPAVVLLTSLLSPVTGLLPLPQL